MGARGPLRAVPANPARPDTSKGKGKKRPAPLRAAPSRPTPPDDLTGDALVEWNRVVPELDELGILSVLDRAVLARYCLAWQQWREFAATLDAEGMVIDDARGGKRKHPAWQMFREAGTMLDAAASSCGLSPASRLRMARPEGGDGDGLEPDEILD